MLAILAFSIIPITYEWWKHRRNARRARAVASAPDRPADPQPDAAGADV